MLLTFRRAFLTFSKPENLLEFAQKNLMAGFNQYAPMTGAQPLRGKFIGDSCKIVIRPPIIPKQKLRLPAATQGIYTSIAAFINKGDEVIVFEPAYDCYIYTGVHMEVLNQLA